MDEEIKAAEEAVEASNAQDTGDDNSQIESPTIEETTEEAEGQDEEVATESEGQEAETEGKKGYQSRVKELVRERNEAKAQAQSMAERLAELTGSGEPSGEIPYQPQYQPGQEITPEQLQNDVVRTADAITTLRIKQSEATNRIRNESLDVVRKYPQLDPANESFDKELSETITEAVEAQVRMNPYSASVSKITERLMKPYTRAVANEVGKASENIARQVSQAALRPSSVRKAEKNANEKSIAELEQELGIVQG